MAVVLSWLVFSLAIANDSAKYFDDPQLPRLKKLIKTFTINGDRTAKKLILDIQSDLFFKEHALFFFFASTCKFCHLFAYVLKEFTEQHNITILAFSLDNKPIQAFPNFLPPTTELINAAFKDQPISYPAIFIANPKNALLYPVAFGAMAREELDDRIREIIAKVKDYERRMGYE